MELEINGFATITHHGGAIVCSYETELDISLETVQPRIVKLIHQVQTYVEETGGIVGHIKAYAEESRKSLTFSGTGGDVSVITGQNTLTSVSFAAIVLLTDEKALRQKVEQLFDELEL